MYPVKVTIRDMLKSEVLEDHIIKKAEKLSQYCQRIGSCRVVVDMPQKHKHQGKLFRVSIELNVPGKELVVNRKLDEDVYIAVAHAFDAIERKLEDYGHRKVTSIRRRKRTFDNGVAAVANGHAQQAYPTEVNDEYFLDEFDSEYEEISQITQDQNILRD
jgi:ribosomal subunit interface protein